MAMSHAMSNPTDWLSQPYHADFFSVGQTEAPPTKPTAAGASSRNTFSLSPDQGRVAKPIRRRSRASRRTPTTLFNTDTTNFRAMVQRFTGFPTAAYPSGPHGGGLNFMDDISAAAPAGGGNRPESGFYARYPSQELRRQQQMMFMMGGEATENEDRSYDNYVL